MEDRKKKQMFFADAVLFVAVILCFNSGYDVIGQFVL